MILGGDISLDEKRRMVEDLVRYPDDMMCSADYDLEEAVEVFQGLESGKLDPNLVSRVYRVLFPGSQQTTEEGEAKRGNMGAGGVYPEKPEQP